MLGELLPLVFLRLLAAVFNDYCLLLILLHLHLFCFFYFLIGDVYILISCIILSPSGSLSMLNLLRILTCLVYKFRLLVTLVRTSSVLSKEFLQLCNYLMSGIDINFLSQVLLAQFSSFLAKLCPEN